MYLFVLVLVVLICVLTGATLVLMQRAEMSWMQAILDAQRIDHQTEKRQWELERERLLNRAMVKEWTSYAQLQSRLTTVSDSTSEPTGMSDEEELRRMGDTGGIGEVLVDLTDELQQFGLVEKD